MKRRRLEHIYYYFNKDRRAVVRKKSAPRPGHLFLSQSGKQRGGGPWHFGELGIGLRVGVWGFFVFPGC